MPVSVLFLDCCFNDTLIPDNWDSWMRILPLGSILKVNCKMRWKEWNYWSRWLIDISLTLFRMSLFKAAYGWFWGQKYPPPTLPPSIISHIFHNDETWHSYILLAGDPKNSISEISISSPGISNFCYIKKYQYRLHINA